MGCCARFTSEICPFC